MTEVTSPRQRSFAPKCRQVTGVGAALVLLSLTASPGLAADLTVSVTDLQPGAGRLYVALHGEAGADAFPGGDGIMAGNWKLVTADQTRVVFSDLPPGRYAVAAFHDQNGNEELDSNLLGIPTEGYGFSKGASGLAGPPSFEDAAVMLGQEDQQVLLPVSY
ncbi:DUF2141 domain-containing protein [Rhodovibrionaceae bacterium A322]